MIETCNSQIYKIDSQVSSEGKKLLASKKCSSWTIGVGGIDRDGRKGKAYTIKMNWSLASGKKQVFIGKKEVFYSMDRQSKLNVAWKYKGMVFTLTAYSSSFTLPQNKTKGRKQFELKVNGVSFDDLPTPHEISNPQNEHMMMPSKMSPYKENLFVACPRRSLELI